MNRVESALMHLEAVRVYEVSELTPLQLLEQRDELLAILEDAIDLRLTCHADWDARVKKLIEKIKGE